MITQVTYSITNGGLGRPEPSRDGVSCFYKLVDTATIDYPGTMSETAPIRGFKNGIQELEAFGITSNSDYADLHYMASEFFLNNGGTLYIAIFDSTDYTHLTAIDAIVQLTNGEVRLFGYYDPAWVLSEANVLAINTKLENANGLKKPASFIIGANTAEMTKASLPNLRNMASDARHVSVVIGQDSTGFATSDPLIGFPNVGAIVGALSSTDVAQNILEIGKFNYAANGTMILPAFIFNDGTNDAVLLPISNATVTPAYVDEIDEKGYIFYRYMPNVPGTFINNDHTATKITSDFYCIHYNRVMGKVLRETDKSLTVLIGKKVLVNPNGTISNVGIEVYKGAVSAVLAGMRNAGELNDYKIFVDPTQKPIVDNTVRIEIRIQPIPSGDYITAVVGFTGSV